MHDLLNTAALTVQQKNVIEAIGEEEFVEDCFECDLEDDELLGELDLDLSLTLDADDILDLEFLDENEDLDNFVRGILEEVGIDDEEIDNYLCENGIEGSFLCTSFYDQNQLVEITIDKEKLLTYLREVNA